MTTPHQRPYPFDFNNLKKGDVISAQQIEDYTGVSRDTSKYGLAVLKVRTLIEIESQLRGQTLTLKQNNGELVVCMDEEASVENSRRCENGLRKYMRAHRRMCGVDVNNLSADRKPIHDRELIRQGRILGSIIRAETKLATEGHKRTLPIMTKIPPPQATPPVVPPPPAPPSV